MNKKIVIYANGWNGDNLSHYMEGLKEGLEGEAVDLHVFLGHDAYGLDETEWGFTIRRPMRPSMPQSRGRMRKCTGTSGR